MPVLHMANGHITFATSTCGLDLAKLDFILFFMFRLHETYLDRLKSDLGLTVNKAQVTLHCDISDLGPHAAIMKIIVLRLEIGVYEDLKNNLEM